MNLKFSLTQREYLLVFAFSLAIVFGNAYLILVNHDANFSSDEASYLALGNGNWDVNITHRYRVIIPFLARGLAECFLQLGALAGMKRTVLPLGFTFFMVNTTVMALAGVVIYSIVKAVNVNLAGRFIAILGVLTSGYCSYLSGIALVDSLYFLMLALLFYSVINKNEPALLCCLLIGPLAKESFWLFIPFILLFGRFIPFHRLFFYILLAACVFMATNALIDSVSGIKAAARAQNAVEHIHNALITIRKLFSLSGFMSWFSAFGLFNFLVLAGLLKQKIRITLTDRLTQIQLMFLLIIGAHVLLSGDIGRMWYLTAPVYAIALGFCTERMLEPLLSLHTQSLKGKADQV
jgi:hypothetical protein